MTEPAVKFDPTSITRPDKRLFTYYVVISLLTFIAAPITFIPLWIRYHTLRYRFDKDGVGMSVGVLFKRETYLTYRRIQDIHVTRGLIQRWLGLASVAVQTASGASTAEMTIEGMPDPDALRDWLYTRMRGAHEHDTPVAPQPGSHLAASPHADEALELLQEIRDGLKVLAAGRAGGSS